MSNSERLQKLADFGFCEHQEDIEMELSGEEKTALPKLKGVRLTVVKRFEEIGINSFKELQKYQAMKTLLKW